MTLTKKQILHILDNKKLINKCSKSEKGQVFEFAFGREFMDSINKGSKKVYKDN